MNQKELTGAVHSYAISTPHRAYAVLQPFRCIELIIHIAISVLTGTQVRHLKAKCPAQGHNLETMSQNREERIYFFKNPAPSMIRNRDIDKAPRSNHCSNHPSLHGYYTYLFI